MRCIKCQHYFCWLCFAELNQASEHKENGKICYIRKLMTTCILSLTSLTFFAKLLSKNLDLFYLLFTNFIVFNICVLIFNFLYFHSFWFHLINLAISKNCIQTCGYSPKSILALILHFLCGISYLMCIQIFPVYYFWNSELMQRCVLFAIIGLSLVFLLVLYCVVVMVGR